MPGLERTTKDASAADPTGSLVARAERAAETRAHELESGLTRHLGRLRAASENARRELEAGVIARRETLTRTVTVPPGSNRRIHRVLERLHAQGRRSRAAVAGALVVAILAATGAFVATQVAPGDQRAQRSPSTSIARSSPSATATTAPSPDSVVATEAAPAPDASPAFPAAPAAPGTSNSARAPAPGTASAPRPASPAPGSSGAPPSGDSPPSSPPRSPTCQLLPVVCP